MAIKIVGWGKKQLETKMPISWESIRKRPLGIEILGLLLVTAVLAAGWYWRLPNHPTPGATRPGEVTVEQTLAWGNKVLWLDARTLAHYQEEHIPGALPLNEDHWDEQLSAVIAAYDPNHYIVIYCATTQCSQSHEVAARLEKETPIRPVYVLAGGWERWQQSRH